MYTSAVMQKTVDKEEFLPFVCFLLPISSAKLGNIYSPVCPFVCLSHCGV